MDDTTQTAEPQKTEEGKQPDVFALDENSLISLTPEQRAGLDPIINKWKETALSEIQKREEAVRGKYKPLEERASALEKLSQYKPFQDWWNEQQKNAGKPQSDPTGGQAAQFARPEEWQQAIYEASQGDATKLTQIQARMMASWAGPLASQLQEKQLKIETELELKGMFERHPDAKNLDAIGIDPKSGEGISLLQQALEWAESQGKSMEEGYQLAKKWADQIQVEKQQEAMGMVREKKQGTTESAAGRGKETETLEEAEDTDDLLKKAITAGLSGQKVRYVIKGK